MTSAQNRNYADKPFTRAVTVDAGEAARKAWAIAHLGLAILVMAGMLALTGCSVAPSTSIQHPLTARPAEAPVRPAGNGAIYQAGYVKLALFEDRRARNVGDTLTVVVNEKNSASSNSNASGSHSGSNKLTLSPNIFASSASTGTNTTLLDASAASKFEDKGANANNDIFTGTLTVTVLEVLPNGNLLVSGEKQVSVGEKTEFLRLSGIVNPANVGATNSIYSTQLADAHIEFKNNQYIDGAKITSMLARFFLTVMF